LWSAGRPTPSGKPPISDTLRVRLWMPGANHSRKDMSQLPRLEGVVVDSS